MIEDEMEQTPVESHHEWATRQTDEKRRKAYADPLTGSDSLFTKAARMESMQEPGADEIRQQAVDRYNQIKTALPWPVV